jgi:hypothetical protein
LEAGFYAIHLLPRLAYHVRPDSSSKGGACGNLGIVTVVVTHPPSARHLQGGIPLSAVHMPEPSEKPMIRSALTHHPKLSSELLQRYGESRLTPSVSDLPRHGVCSLLIFVRFCFRLLWSISFSPRARQCGTSSRQHSSLRSALKRGRIRQSVLGELGRQSGQWADSVLRWFDDEIKEFRWCAVPRA